MKKSRIALAAAAAVFVLSAAICIYMLFFKPKPQYVRITSGGKTLYTLDLTKEKDRLITVEYDGRKNVIEIKDGRIHMLEADCPDHVCIDTGWLDNGLPIVCMPNRLVIEAVGKGSDAAVG